MYRSLFPRDVFAELDRFQRDIQRSLDGASPSIRGIGRGGYPAINVGGTPQSFEIYAFAPGLDPDKIELNLERGVLTISGEREASRNGDETAAVHIDERFAGRFRRVLSLPDDIDPGAVDAAYRDGVLHISIKRRASAQPRRIEIK
jgi:HSP20 family protein